MHYLGYFAMWEASSDPCQYELISSSPVMQRLDNKGLLDRTRSGRYDTYTPRLSREEYQERRAAAQVQGLVDEFGDVALAHFTQSLQTLDPARRRQLRRLAGQL